MNFIQNIFVQVNSLLQILWKHYLFEYENISNCKELTAIPSTNYIIISPSPPRGVYNLLHCTFLSPCKYDTWTCNYNIDTTSDPSSSSLFAANQSTRSNYRPIGVPKNYVATRHFYQPDGKFPYNQISDPAKLSDLMGIFSTNNII